MLLRHVQARGQERPAALLVTCGHHMHLKPDGDPQAPLHSFAAQKKRTLHGARQLEVIARHVLVAAQAKALDRIAQRLDPAGVPFVLFKGCALQRYYPAEAVRPVGDIDLVVAPGRLPEVACLLNASTTPKEAHAASLSFAAFTDLPGTAGHLDLHADLNIYGLEWTDLLERSVRATFGSRSVRVLCEEHHFRLVCLHFLKHGAFRRLWLDDICHMLERLDRGFDWASCTGGSPAVRNWLGAAINLAHDVGGADISRVPCDIRAQSFPDWIDAEARRALEKPDSDFHARPLITRTVRTNPANLPREIAARWPSQIASFVRLGIPYGKHPPVLVQIALMARRVAWFALRIVTGTSKAEKRAIVGPSTDA